MDLHQLRAFIEVAKEGKLTRAAQVLCLSQPAVSAKIKLLEDEIGVVRGFGLSILRQDQALAAERAGEWSSGTTTPRTARRHG
jgi:hypothetical protein